MSSQGRLRRFASVQSRTRHSHMGADIRDYACLSRGRSGAAMNAAMVEKIADAVLYEGYLLYPYRPSAVKNQQRFNFGVLYPREYCDLQLGSESCEMRTEILVLGGPSTTIEVKVRFLQLVGQPILAAAGFQPAPYAHGHERDVSAPPCSLESIAARPHRQEFAFTEI